jgi:hypothetical protein
MNKRLDVFSQSAVMGNLKKLQNGKQNNFRTYIEIYEIVDGN